MGGFAQLAAVWKAVSGTPSFVVGMRLAVAGVFLLDGIHKLRRPRETAASIAHFRLARLATVRVAVLLGLVEVVLAAGLVIPGAARVAGAGCAVMSAAFVFLTARAYRGGERFVCNCLSSSADPIDAVTVGRAAALALGAAVGTVLPVAAPTPARLPLAAAVAAVVTGLPLAAVVLRRSVSMRRRYLSRVDWDFLVARWTEG